MTGGDPSRGGGEPSLYSPLLEAATRLAAQGHYHQFRKGAPIDIGHGESGRPLPSGWVPYITHLVGTMCILARFGVRDEVLAAALLHDYLEDVHDESGPDTIQRTVGDEVLDLVLSLTEARRPGEDRSDSWESRKHDQISKIARLPEEAVLIKAADMLHNLLSLVGDLEAASDDAEVWGRFNASPERQMWYYRSLRDAVEARLGRHAVVDELGRAIDHLGSSSPLATRD